MTLRHSASVLSIALIAGSRLVAPSPAQAETKSIFIETRAPHPREVRFDGGDDFARSGTTHEGPVSVADGMDVRDIAIEFSNVDMPLRVIVNPRRSGSIRFTVQAPSATRCERSLVNSVDIPSGSIRERVNRMIQARRLMKLCENVSLVQPKLALAYYNLSCSLASDEGTFFAIHRDADIRLRRTPMPRRADKNRRSKLLNDCRGKGVAKQFDLAWTTIKSSNPGEATALIDEVLRAAADPKLAEGFAVSQIGIQNVRQRKVWDLKRQQIAASNSNDLGTALSLTDQIEALRRLEGFDKAADLQGAGTETLKRDRAWFITRKNAADAKEAAAEIEAAELGAETAPSMDRSIGVDVGPAQLESIDPATIEAAKAGTDRANE